MRPGSWPWRRRACRSPTMPAAWPPGRPGHAVAPTRAFLWSRRWSGLRSGAGRCMARPAARGLCRLAAHREAALGYSLPFPNWQIERLSDGTSCSPAAVAQLPAVVRVHMGETHADLMIRPPLLRSSAARSGAPPAGARFPAHNPTGLVETRLAGYRVGATKRRACAQPVALQRPRPHPMSFSVRYPLGLDAAGAPDRPHGHRRGLLLDVAPARAPHAGAPALALALPERGGGAGAGGRATARRGLPSLSSSPRRGACPGRRLPHVRRPLDGVAGGA